MKRIIKILILSIFTIFLFSGFTSSVLADSSTVEFENTPLFGETNFAPGNSISKWIKLNNNNDINHYGIIRALDVVNEGKLGDVTNLQIKQGDTLIYEGTFSDFFNEDKVDLSEVVARGSATFDLIITFDSNSDNEYQNSTMSFSLQAGFEDDTSTDTVTIGSSGSYITSGPHILIITDDQAINNTLDEFNTMTITWNTNIPATSQVVYGLASGGPYTLDLDAPNFGYPSSTIEQDLGKVLSHTVIIPNLTLGVYSYRVVSRASPPTIGYERYFTVSSRQNALNLLALTGSEDGLNDPVLGNFIRSENDLSGQGLFGDNSTENNFLGASAGRILGLRYVWFYSLLALITLLFIFWFLFFWRRKKKK